MRHDHRPSTAAGSRVALAPPSSECDALLPSGLLMLYHITAVERGLNEHNRTADALSISDGWRWCFSANGVCRL